MKILHKIIAGFAVVLALVFGIGAVAMVGIHRSLASFVGKNSAALAAQTMEMIDRNIYEQHMKCRQIAYSIRVRAAAMQSNREFEELRDPEEYVRKVDSAWIAAPRDAVTPLMKGLIENDLAEELRQNAAFYEAMSGYDVFPEIFLTNRYGANVAQTGKTTDFKQDDEAWWIGARDHGFFIGDVEYDRSSEVYSLDLSARVDDAEGEFAGVVKAVLNIEEIFRIILEAGDYFEEEGVEFYLATHTGNLVYPEGGKLPACLPMKVIFGNIGKMGPVGYFKSPMGEHDGHRKFFSYAVSPGYRSYPGMGWVFIIARDEEEMFAPVQRLRNEVLAAGLVALVAALLVSFFVAKGIARPIQRLSRTASEIGKGNLDAAVKISSREDEVGQLADAFREMARNLKRSMTQLEKSNKELDAFIYTASHDLRSPLRAISSFAAFLEEEYGGRLDEKGRGYVDHVVKGTARMNDLIEDLLQLSRISRIRNPYEPVNMRELLESVRDHVLEDMGQPPARVVITGSPPVVVCDRVKMRNVFTNLVSNGIKFAVKLRRDKTRVEIGYVTVERHHEFFVKDNGIGIDPKFHTQIFGLFRRLHTRKEYEGTGAGLSIVKRVIEDHGGQIWVESRPGKGAMFRFTLPKNLEAA